VPSIISAGVEEVMAAYPDIVPVTPITWLARAEARKTTVGASSRIGKCAASAGASVRVAGSPVIIGSTSGFCPAKSQPCRSIGITFASSGKADRVALELAT
jgi:hypothetical protein